MKNRDNFLKSKFMPVLNYMMISDIKIKTFDLSKEKMCRIASVEKAACQNNLNMP